MSQPAMFLSCKRRDNAAATARLTPRSQPEAQYIIHLRTVFLLIMPVLVLPVLVLPVLVLPGKTFVAASAASTVLSPVASPGAQQPSSASVPEETAVPSFVTGRRLQDALQKRMSITETNSTLKAVCESFSAHTEIALIRDRRLDPDFPVDLVTEFVPARDVLEQMKQAVPGTAISVTDKFVYIGPQKPAERLRTLIEVNRHHLQDQRRLFSEVTLKKLSSSEYAGWPQLSEPQALMKDATEAAGLSITNPDLVPHDLWAAAQFPELDLCEYLTVVLNQYDLSFNGAQRDQLAIVDCPADVAVEQRYRIAAADVDSVKQKWLTRFPELKVSWRGTTAVVTTTLENHDELQSIRRGDEATETTSGDSLQTRLFTMKVPAGTRLGAVVEHLRNSGIPVRIEGRTDEELTTLLASPVEFDVQKQPGRQFFEGIFRSVGGKAEVTPKEVIVRF